MGAPWAPPGGAPRKHANSRGKRGPAELTSHWGGGATSTCRRPSPCVPSLVETQRAPSPRRSGGRGGRPESERTLGGHRENLEVDVASRFPSGESRKLCWNIVTGKSMTPRCPPRKARRENVHIPGDLLARPNDPPTGGGALLNLPASLPVRPVARRAVASSVESSLRLTWRTPGIRTDTRGRRRAYGGRKKLEDAVSS